MSAGGRCPPRTSGRRYPRGSTCSRCSRTPWFSGHTANAVLIALAAGSARPWIKGLAWGNVIFRILLVLSTRTHYTIDVLGGIFVAYSIHRVSLDAVAFLNRPVSHP